MKKTKENVYVVIDTPKKAKKVKKVLDMFGERYGSATLSEEDDYKGIFQTLFYNEFEKEFWIGKESRRDGKTEVSIKELRNILAVEHLKEGDVVVTKTGSEKIIAVYDHACQSNLVLFQAKRWVRVSDGFKWNNEGCFDTFIRFATEEEKALLEGKPKLEIGKWYTCDEYPKFFSYQTDEKRYGIDIFGKWFEVYDKLADDLTFYREATKEEVEQALIKEAKKRGYADGVKVKCLLLGQEYTLTSRKHWNDFDGEELLMVEKEGTGVWVFKDGKWAEIVEPLTIKPVINGKDLKVVLDGKPLRCEHNVKLEIKDIAVIEQLHDLLLDSHGYSLDYKLLSDARELAQKLTKLI